MFTRFSAILAIAAVAEARFGQEQVPVAAIQALSNFGNPGQAATLAGSVPSSLLGAADPCAKLKLADDIVAALGNDPAVLAAASGLVAAEQNFNPFATDVPNICGDASLPATTELRGITPLVDPAVTGAEVANALSEQSLANALNSNGLSVAAIMQANGFNNLKIDGAAAGGAAGGNAGGNAGNGNNNNNNNAGNGNNNNNAGNGNNNNNAGNNQNCGGNANAGNGNANAGNGNNNNNNAGNGNANAGNGNANAGAGAATGAGAVDDAVTGTFAGFQASSLGVDFGTCTPTVKFEESLNGRKAGEFTFQAIDPVVNKGQQEALNFDIIFNRICDQLGNVCNASDAGVTLCKDTQAALKGGARDVTTADAWNDALGFAGTNTNPDNAPKAGLVGHT